MVTSYFLVPEFSYGLRTVLISHRQCDTATLRVSYFHEMINLFGSGSSFTSNWLQTTTSHLLRLEPPLQRQSRTSRTLQLLNLPFLWIDSFQDTLEKVRLKSCLSLFIQYIGRNGLYKSTSTVSAINRSLAKRQQHFSIPLKLSLIHHYTLNLHRQASNT